MSDSTPRRKGGIREGFLEETARQRPQRPGHWSTQESMLHPIWDAGGDHLGGGVGGGCWTLPLAGVRGGALAETHVTTGVKQERTPPPPCSPPGFPGPRPSRRPIACNRASGRRSRLCHPREPGGCTEQDLEVAPGTTPSLGVGRPLRETGAAPAGAGSAPVSEHPPPGVAGRWSRAGAPTTPAPRPLPPGLRPRRGRAYLLPPAPVRSRLRDVTPRLRTRPRRSAPTAFGGHLGRGRGGRDPGPSSPRQALIFSFHKLILSERSRCAHLTPDTGGPGRAGPATRSSDAFTMMAAARMKDGGLAS